MKKSGTGVGSASIVLIFAVVGLTVFSLITYSIAANERVLAEREANLVINYYYADAAAELFLAELLDGNFDINAMPKSERILEIVTAHDYYSHAEFTNFTVSITEDVVLSVIISVYEDYFNILRWRILNLAEWTADNRLNVWLPDEYDFNPPDYY